MKSINASTHQRINASTHQRINTISKFKPTVLFQNVVIGLSLVITLLVFSSELQAQNKDPGEFLSPIPQVETQLKSNEINRFNTFKNNKETYKSVTLVSTKDIVKYQHNKTNSFHWLYGGIGVGWRF